MIWILGNEKMINSYENEALIKELDKEAMFLDTHYINILKTKNNTKYFYKQSEITKPEIVLPKLGCMLDEQAKEILKSLKQDKVKLINDVELLEITANKFLTAMYLFDNDIEHIKSLKVISHIGDISNIVKNNFEYPVILKSKVGSLGRGIYKINTQEELVNTTDQINLLNKAYEFLIQEYIEEGNTTYRVLVLGGKVQYIMKNKSEEGKFKSNYTLSEKAELINKPYDNKITNLINTIYKVLPMDIMGIDLIRKQSGEYIVCEINSNPGFKAYNSLGYNFEQKIASYINKQKENLENE